MSNFWGLSGHFGGKITASLLEINDFIAGLNSNQLLKDEAYGFETLQAFLKPVGWFKKIIMLHL